MKLEVRKVIVKRTARSFTRDAGSRLVEPVCRPGGACLVNKDLGHCPSSAGQTHPFLGNFPGKSEPTIVTKMARAVGLAPPYPFPPCRKRSRAKAPIVKKGIRFGTRLTAIIEGQTSKSFRSTARILKENSFSGFCSRETPRSGQRPSAPQFEKTKHATRRRWARQDELNAAQETICKRPLKIWKPPQRTHESGERRKSCRSNEELQSTNEELQTREGRAAIGKRRDGAPSTKSFQNRNLLARSSHNNDSHEFFEQRPILSFGDGWGKIYESGGSRRWPAEKYST